jgi:hypothetical protein
VDIEGFVRRRVGVAVLALLVVVVPMACSNGGGEAEQKPDSRDQDDDEGSGAPGEDADGDSGDDEGADNGDGDDDNASGDPEADARAAYVAYQTMFERLAVAPDSDDPEITELTSGAELNHVVDTLTEFENGGLAVVFGDDHKHNVYEVTVGADGVSATVLDCFISDARVVNADTRGIVRGDPEGGTATVVTASVVRDAEGTWKVDATGSEDVEPNGACGSEGVISDGS